MNDGRLAATISLSMKVNLGNYESADCFISVQNITDDTTAEEVEALLDGPAKISYDLLKTRVAARARALKAGGA
jgi:hypothetical protein